MKIVIVEDRGTIKVEGLPDEHVVIFLAKLDDLIGYIVIFRPQRCLNDLELWDANVAIGKLGEEAELFGVKHGHKYSQGGGFVDCADGREISFGNPRDQVRRFFYCKQEIPRGNVLIAT